MEMIEKLAETAVQSDAKEISASIPAKAQYADQITKLENLQITIKRSGW